MVSQPAIQIENLSKRYRIEVRHKRTKTLTGTIGSWLKAPITNFNRLQNRSRFEGDEQSLIWALKNVSFQVNHGEVIGIIGRNGAGKSTLLKIISRITDPTEGRVIIRGVVSSLLEVGTGFHQELTGSENVYLNGTILGMSKREIDRKFDEIVAFAEVEKFIDTPVKHYSSGMKVRLAFSVAAHLEPDVLIVDEVLAVGDAAFQRKCLGKMGEVASKGRTVLFVSHTMGAVRSLCERVVLLEEGRKVMDGEAGDVIDRYLQSNNGENISTWKSSAAEVSENKDCSLLEVTVHDEKGKNKNSYVESDEIFVSVRYLLFRSIPGLRIKLRVLTDQGVVVITTSDAAGTNELREPGEYVSVCRFPRSILNNGLYSVIVFASVPPFGSLSPRKVYVKFMVERTISQGSTAQEKLYGVLNPYAVRWTVDTVPVSKIQS